MMRRNALSLLLAFGVWLSVVHGALASCVPPYTHFIPIAQAESTLNDFYIIQPQGITNLVNNPTNRQTSNGFIAMAGSLARSTTKTRRGISSVQITPTSSVNDGMYFATVSLTSGSTYTFSVDVWAPLGVPFRIYFGSTAGAVLGTPYTFTGTGDWQRVEVAYTETSTTSRRLYVTKNNNASVADFWVDGFQAELGSYATTYCDGEQPGCIWNGQRYLSTSSRSANERSGGKKVFLDTLNAYLISQSGTGMAPVVNQFQAYASIDGGVVQQQITKERSFTIAFSVAGDGTVGWHQRRQAIINLIKSDLVYPQQPFVLGYRAGGSDVEIQCWYEDGFGIADGIQDIEAIPIKCLAPKPHWKPDGQSATALTTQSSLSGNYLWQRSSSGLWSGMGTSPNNYISDLLYDKSTGYLYAFGAHTTIGGVSARTVSRWDGSTWASTSISSSYALTGRGAIGPGGIVYVPVLNGANYQVYKYNGVSTWTQVGGNFSGLVTALTVAPNGTLYAVGLFATANAGVTTVNNVAYWTGSTWAAMGTGTAGGSPTAGKVWSVLAGRDGYVYVAGEFATAGGVTVNGIARWNGTAWSGLAGGFAGATYNRGFVMVIGLDNMLYVGGQFATAGGITAANIARWNGTAWQSLGAGLGGVSDIVNDLRVHPLNGRLYASGPTSSGTFSFADESSFWNGSSWNTVDIDFSSASNVVMEFSPNGTMYLAQDNATTQVVPGQTTVTNASDAKTYGKFLMFGPNTGTAKIYRIEIAGTGKMIHLNYTINSGETALLDLRPGTMSFSSDFQGDLWSTIRPGSNTKDFALMPGANLINVFASDSTVAVTAIWEDRCWSVDGSAP